LVLAKVVAGFGALSLVAAFAMAMLLRPFMSLGQLIMSIDQPFLTALDQTPRTGGALWIWSHLAVPVLLRPAWMMPTMLGIVLVGLAAQLAWGRKR
jgi:hypothetical protein